jgi:hypothetical protein
MNVGGPSPAPNGGCHINLTQATRICRCALDGAVGQGFSPRVAAPRFVLPSGNGIETGATLTHARTA